jgi:two-component system cell cycle response regulator
LKIAEKLTKPCLVIISQDGLGEVFPLVSGGNTLGSGEEANVHLPYRGIDPVHATLHLDETLTLEANSANLVLIDGQVVSGSRALQVGNTIELGVVTMKYREFDEEDETYHEALRQLAIRDGLTNLFNARYFRDALVKEHDFCVRKQSSLALLFMDIDHFKQINDRFGHAFGDFVLKELARLLTTRLRGYDLLARYGGEEFVFLVREESPESVHELAERICADARNHVFHFAGVRTRVTVSIGYEWWNGIDRDLTSEDLLRRADDQLYRAKSNGRDRVEPNEGTARASAKS